MTVELSLLQPATRIWASDAYTADITLAGVDAEGQPLSVTLTGMSAAAYLFGQALTTARYQDLNHDGLQLSDGLFEFPPNSDEWVTLSELSDALLYKYGVDPVIEFAPGLGLRGYSVADINNILTLLNREFGAQFLPPEPGVPRLALLDSATIAAQTASDPVNSGITITPELLAAESESVQPAATDSELREYLTEGGDIYVDRDGHFFINGVSTTAMNLAVTSRLLVQDNINAEYKLLMDAFADRNNETAASQEIIDGGLEGLSASIAAVESQYGMTDALAELTAGQFTDSDFFFQTNVAANTITLESNPGWANGTRIQTSMDTAGLVAGRDYYLHVFPNNTYKLYYDSNHATAPISSDPSAPDPYAVDLTGPVLKSLFEPPSVGSIASESAFHTLVEGINPPTAVDSSMVTINWADHLKWDSTNKCMVSDMGMHENDDNHQPMRMYSEDQEIEFSTGGNGVSAGTNYFVKNVFVNGKYIGWTVTSGANNDTSVLTGVNASFQMYDHTDDNTEAWKGTDRFTMPDVNFATGTSFKSDRNVDFYVEHYGPQNNETEQPQTFYRAFTAIWENQTYYLHHNDDGSYSVYNTRDNALAGGNTGKIWFWNEDLKVHNYVDNIDGTAGSYNYKSWQFDTDITIQGLNDARLTMSLEGRESFETNPRWSTGTKVEALDSSGTIVAGQEYYVKVINSSGGGLYEFYSDSALSQRAYLSHFKVGSSPYGVLPRFSRVVPDSVQGNLDGTSKFTALTALLNTVIGNNVRDGDLDQSKLQTLTAQLQNNTEAMTALIKFFADLNANLAQALR